MYILELFIVCAAKNAPLPFHCDSNWTVTVDVRAQMETFNFLNGRNNSLDSFSMQCDIYVTMRQWIFMFAHH